MADVNKEEADARRVDQGEKRVVQYLGDEVGDCFDCGFLDKVEIGQVNEDKDENGNAGVGHGLRSQGAATRTRHDCILAATGLAVLQEENDAGDNMEEENGIKTKFKIGTKMPKECR